MKRFYLLIGIMLLPLMGMAQARFYAKTDAREVLVNSFVQVEFVLENASGKDFTPPDFSPLQVVSGPSSSSQISIINGKRTEKKGYGYTLLADKAGVYTIGSASIRVGRTVMKTKPIEIEVIDRRSSSGDADQMEEVFVKAEISDTIAYPGQQLLLRYVLYTTKRVSSYNYLSNPDYEGFYVQEINTRDDVERRVVNGVEYSTQVFQTIALFPQKLGELYLKPAQFSLGISQRNDPFSMFGRSRQVPVTTNDNWIKVIPLPEGAPESFNGAIGKYDMRVRLSNRKATTDDALSLKVEIQGNGLAKFIEAPKLDLGDQFDVYDPKVIDESIYATDDDIVSKKDFEYLLVPKKEGRQSFQIPFTYFDTDSSQYKSLYSPVFNVQILPGQNNLAGLTPEEILEKYQLKPMMLDSSLSRSSSFFFGSTAFYILLILLVLLFPALWLYKQYLIRRGKIDPAELKRRRAEKEATKRLAIAKAQLGAADPSSFYKAISEAFEKYISDKFSIQTADLSKENIAQQLRTKQVDESSVQEYLEVLQHCELALFGGVSQRTNQELYDKADRLMQKMMVDLEKG
jgi:hypothetical protein